MFPKYRETQEKGSVRKGKNRSMEHPCTEAAFPALFRAEKGLFRRKGYRNLTGM